jgi:hypothetical protein
MAALLNATSFVKLGLCIKSSSHLSDFDKNATYIKVFKARSNENAAIKESDKARKNFRDCFPKGSQINAWGGLTLAPDQYPYDSANLCKLPKKSASKKNQVQEMAQVIRTSKCKISLQLSGSNDFKFFMVNNNQLVPLSERSIVAWKSWTDKRKSCFSPVRTRLFSKESETFIKGQVGKYVAIVVEMYKGSNFDFVFHSSILERVYSKIESLENVDIYFAYVNYYLKLELQKLNGQGIVNNAGKKISWHFINVADQFHSTTSYKKLFKSADVYRKEMVHRNIDFMKILIDRYLQSIYEVLVKESVI